MPEHRTLYVQRDFPIFQNRMYGPAEAARAFPRGDIRLVQDFATGLVSEAAFKPEQTAYDAAYHNGHAHSPSFQTLSRYFPKAGLSFDWCRLFYLFGEGEHERRSVPTIRNALEAGRQVPLTDGNQVRDYMDVASAAEEVVRIALGDTLGPGNVCSGQPSTVREMAEQVADTFSARQLLRFGALPRRLDEPQRIVGLRSNQK